jgi:hypothetical protein
VWWLIKVTQILLPQTPPRAVDVQGRPCEINEIFWVAVKMAQPPAALKYKSSAQPVKSKFDLRIPVDYPGAILKYSLGTQAYDIDFTLVFESEFDGEQTVLVPETRISFDEPLIGEYVFKMSKGYVVFK